MGLFWDLVQQTQISENETRSGEIEQRVMALEEELRKTQEVLHQVVTRLEKTVGQDLDSDGVVG